jgi:hypothetical protein
MTKWRKVVNVYGVLDAFPDMEDADVQAASIAMVTLLDAQLPEYMEDYGEGLRELAEFGEEDRKEVADLQYEIDGLFEYADNTKIWMGFGVIE